MTHSPVIGVLSGCGGAGASVFAAVLAGCAPPSVLIDCDRLGGGIDVLLGCERQPGPRWPQVRLGGGDLDPDVLLEALPRWGTVPFLATSDCRPLDGAAVAQVVDAAARRATVVLDLPRWDTTVRSVAADRCDLTVLVVPAEVRAVTAAAAVVRELDPATTCLAVRGSSRSLPAARIATVLGLPLSAELVYDPASRYPGGLELHRLRRGTRRAGRAVLTRLQAAAVAA